MDPRYPFLPLWRVLGNPSHASAWAFPYGNERHSGSPTPGIRCNRISTLHAQPVQPDRCNRCYTGVHLLHVTWWLASGPVRCCAHARLCSARSGRTGAPSQCTPIRCSHSMATVCQRSESLTGADGECLWRWNVTGTGAIGAAPLMLSGADGLNPHEQGSGQDDGVK